MIGEEWRGAFDVLLTRDNTPHVKPDKRSLLHFAEVGGGMCGVGMAEKFIAWGSDGGTAAHAAMVCGAALPTPPGRAWCDPALQVWGMRPWELLMVGDSTEDIETANAAGTASCLIAGGYYRYFMCMHRPCTLCTRALSAGRPGAGRQAQACGCARGEASDWEALIHATRPSPAVLFPPPGGGNETSAAAAAAPPPRGAVPTFTVDSLAHLQRRLEARDTALGWGASGSGTLSLSSSDSEDASGDGAASLAGAPPEGLDFLDALFGLGAVQASAAGVWPACGEGSGACRGGPYWQGGRYWQGTAA